MADEASKPAAEGTATAAAPVPPTPVLPHGTRLYEAMWVVDANVARESMTKVMAGLKEIVEKSGGTWINGDKWEERRLAYSIKKKKRGMYVLSHFSSATESLTRLERNIQISDLVLRALVTKDEDGLTTAQPVRTIEDDDFGGGFGGGGGHGGGERRFSRPDRDRGPRPSFGSREGGRSSN